MFISILGSDSLYALGALIFVFFIFIMHLKSYFLSLIGITLILFSFPLTVLLCKSVFQVDYISSLHMFALFTVIGIGADNFFVFMDAWR